MDSSVYLVKTLLPEKVSLMACRTLEEAIKEEIRRYVEACRDHNLRLAHLRYRVILRLRHYV